MKYYINILVLFLIILSLLYIKPVKANLPLIGKVIVVDSGHGGLDPGSTYKNIYEKDITLSIGKYLEKYLSNLGATVVLTRTSDSDLSNNAKSHRKKKDFDERIKIINNKYTDLYISLHLNYLSDSKYYGTQVFYDQDNKDLANTIQQYLNKELKTNREVKEIPTSTYMYKRLTKPGILIECGFLSNKEEREKLVTKEYQEYYALVLAQAINYYYN